MKIKKNDTVLIIAGKDNGKTGKVEKVFPEKGKVIVVGMNMRKKHLKPTKKSPKGGLTEFPGPMNISNVMLLCGKCNKPTRIGYEIIKDKKERKCKKCKEIV